MRLSEVGNSALSKLKGYKNLGSTIMKKKCTRTLKVDNYGLKFQKKGKDGFCNIRKDAYSCYELNVCALPSIHQLSLSLCDGSSVEPLPVWGGGLWEVIRIRWGEEGEALMSGISALIKKTQRPLSLFLLFEDSVRSWKSETWKRLN